MHARGRGRDMNTKGGWSVIAPAFLLTTWVAFVICDFLIQKEQLGLKSTN